MIQSYLPGGANVPSYGGTLAPMCPHRRAHWRHLANTIELVLPLVHPVHNPSGKSIGSAIFSELTAECCRACLGMSFPLIIAPLRRVSGPHLVHASLDLPEFMAQTASQSVHQFLHSSRQSVPILYNGPPFPPQNCPFQ